MFRDFFFFYIYQILNSIKILAENGASKFEKNKNLTAHDSTDKFFVVDIALRVFVTVQEFSDFFIGQFLSWKFTTLNIVINVWLT